MCLNIHPKFPKQYRAGYDILVWKKLHLCRKYDGTTTLISPHRMMAYTLGQRIDVGYLDRTPCFYGSKGFEVNYGLHAYVRQKDLSLFGNGNRNLYPAVIPKGALFYRGEWGDIVATSLIVYPIGWDKKVGAKTEGNWHKHTPVRHSTRPRP